MTIYEIALERSVLSLGVGFEYQGGRTAERQGIFVIRLMDSNGVEYPASETGLTVSTFLNTNFCYVTETMPGEIMQLRDIRSKLPFKYATLEYRPLFTDKPLQEDKFGIMMLVDLAPVNLGSVETIIIGPAK